MSSMQQLSKKNSTGKFPVLFFGIAADSFGQSFIDWSMYMS